MRFITVSMNRMIIARLMTRSVTIPSQQFHIFSRLLEKNDSSSSSDSSESDDEKQLKKHAPVTSNRDEKAKEETSTMLNNLLEQMIHSQFKPKTMDRAILKKKPLPRPIRKPTLEQKIVDAAKDVAVSLGGNTTETELKLLKKVFCADTFVPTSTDTNETDPSKASLSELLGSMKFQRSESHQSYSAEGIPRSQTSRVREMANKFQTMSSLRVNTMRHERMLQQITISLNSGTPLNIFNPQKQAIEDAPKLETWKSLENRELKSMTFHPPENIFEEMIHWTEKGILWKFPINNEIGMEEEENIHFSEHIFVERHLQDWCPKQGPVRNFMDLVCIGLSKNPYLTVKEKQEHIMWYRDFFGQQQELLKEVGAIQEDIPLSRKQIKS